MMDLQIFSLAEWILPERRDGSAAPAAGTDQYRFIGIATAFASAGSAPFPDRFEEAEAPMIQSG